MDEEAESEPKDVAEGSAGWVRVERGVRHGWIAHRQLE